MENEIKTNKILVLLGKIKQTAPGYIAMLLMLFMTDSGIVAYGSSTVYYISMLACIGAAVYALHSVRGVKFASSSFAVFGLIIVWIGVYSTTVGSGVGQTLKYLSLLVIALYVSYSVKLERFMKIYTDVCFFLAAIAVFMWLIAFFSPELYYKLPSLFLRSNISYSTEIFEYKTLFLANMYKVNYLDIDRLYSIFWEPGVCQAYFNIALIYTVRFMKGIKQFIYFLILIVAVALTLSTSGLVACVFIVGLLIFSKSNSNNMSGKLLRGGFIAVVIFAVIYFNMIRDSVFFNSVFGKLSDGMGNQSVASRLNSIKGNLYILRDNFLFGVGLNKSSEALAFYGIYTNQTNTILDYFATFGFLIGSIYTVCWAFFINKLGKTWVQKLFILGAFVCFFFSEDYIGSVHFYILMLYGARFWLDDKKTPIEEECL